MEATVLCGNLPCSRHCYSVPLDLCLDAILSMSSAGSFFDLIACFYLIFYIDITYTLYRQACNFQILFNQLHLSQVDDNQGVATFQR